MNNTDTTSAVFAPVTNWISKADAQAKRKELIASGLDKKQVKLSSYRWADLKDHSKGYICRVLVVKGLRPEMEIEQPVRKAKTVKEIATTCVSSNSVEGEVRFASVTDWTATA